MKLLILTQKVDMEDDLLGFMHGWIRELAKRCQSIVVICLAKGQYDLPLNVKVLSLGKEQKKSRLRYVLNFYKFIWQERRNYDVIFVHMNQEYILLAGFFWKLAGKKIVLWYNHLKGNIFSKISALLVDIICYTSPFSFFSKNKKAKIMPVGIDTDTFQRKEDIKKEKNSLLYLGRISSVKNVDILIEAAKFLDDKEIDFTLDIVGEAGEKDMDYFRKIKEKSNDLEKKNKIKFLGSVPNCRTPEVYNRKEIFINLTNPGSMDKTILEAMACENLVLVSNKSFEEIFPAEWHKLMIFKERDYQDLAEKIISIINLTNEEKDEIKIKNRELIIRDHSLKQLTIKLTDIFNQ